MFPSKRSSFKMRNSTPFNKTLRKTHCTGTWTLTPSNMAGTSRTMPEPPEHGQNAGPEPPELLPEPPGLPGNVLEPPRNRPGTLIGWDQNSILLLGKKTNHNHCETSIHICTSEKWWMSRNTNHQYIFYLYICIDDFSCNFASFAA